MADTMTRIYMRPYETNKRLGVILLVVFLVVYVFPFALIQTIALINPSDNISWEIPARIQGVINMRSMQKPPQIRVAVTPLPENRPPRMQGLWNARAIKTIPQYPTALKPLPENRPPRIQGLWNMRMGGIY